MIDEKIFVIGVGDDGIEGLTQSAKQRLNEAELLVGPAAILEKLPSTKARRLVVGGDLERFAEQVTDAKESKIVILASGDPLFYGTARYLCERIGKDRFEVMPHVSSMQLAFARVKESWDEAYLTNLATQNLERVVERVRTAEKVGIFTTELCTPGHVAAALLDRGIDYFIGYICENLGAPDERVTRGALSEITNQTFGPLNVMILIRKANVPDRPVHMTGRRLFGNPDEMFLQSRPKRGLLTTAEVRTIALAEMDLGPSSVVWDVGAGSGSVAIEAAQIASAGQVFAIEMDAEDYNLLLENSQRFGTTNLVPILGEAPQAWRDLPSPDSIFVGGTGRAVCLLVESAWAALRDGGRLVVNLANMENLVAVQNLLQSLKVEPSILMINLARSNMQFEQLRLEAANPSFLIIARKNMEN